MTRDYDRIGRVGGCRCGQSGKDTAFSFVPTVEESLVYATAGADVRGGHGGEIGVSDEVADGGGATEGEDDEGAGFVGCEVPSYVREEGTVGKRRIRRWRMGKG